MVTPTRVNPGLQVYTASLYSVRFTDDEFMSLELAEGTGGGGQLAGTLQVGILVGRTTLPSGLQLTENVLPTLVTWPTGRYR